MLVKFNDPREFIEELKKDAGLVSRGIVRITQQVTCSGKMPIKYLSVVGTTQVINTVVRLDRYCGEIWNIPHVDQKTCAKAEELIVNLKTELESAGLEVRAGIIEEEEAA